MDITIQPKKLRGTIKAIPSKSQAHRLMICAAFSDQKTTLICPETNRDIEATANCLRALGAAIERSAEGYIVEPIATLPQRAILPCDESGSTLRFLLPIIGALGIEGTFIMCGRLSERPLSPLWEEMELHGCRLTRTEKHALHCAGRLEGGYYRIDGSVSSQYITGLLFAAALCHEKISIEITGKAESMPYIKMTQDVLALFGVDSYNYCIKNTYPFRSPGEITVEGDWSNSAFFVAANALGSNITLKGLTTTSSQGDQIVTSHAAALSEHQNISAADIPDLIPILSVIAAANKGAVFSDIRRLRLKESDRVASVRQMLGALGIRTEADENTLVVYPGRILGGTVDAFNDHRIAMSAAIAATVAAAPVRIIGAECVNKSYPSFWEVYRSLGGNYEQYLRNEN